VLRPLVRLTPTLTTWWHWLRTSTTLGPSKVKVKVSASAKLLPITYASECAVALLLLMVLQTAMHCVHAMPKAGPARWMHSAGITWQHLVHQMLPPDAMLGTSA
jgi:hypothetical protein